MNYRVSLSCASLAVVLSVAFVAHRANAATGELRYHAEMVGIPGLEVFWICSSNCVSGQGLCCTIG